MTSLTHLKEKFKTIFMIQRFIIGPLLTLAALAAHAAAVSAGLLPPSAAGLYLFVLLAGFIGGIRAGILSAVMLSAYNVFYLPPMNLERWLVLASYFAAAVMIGWKTRQWRAALAEALSEHTRADKNEDARNIVDTLNGNIVRVVEARELILDILKNNNLDDKTRSRLRSALHTMNNLQQATAGWQELRDLRASIDGGPK